MSVDLREDKPTPIPRPMFEMLLVLLADKIDAPHALKVERFSLYGMEFVPLENVSSDDPWTTRRTTLPKPTWREDRGVK